MTRLLAIETSSEACSIAVTVDGETIEWFEHAPMRHADLLLPAIRAQLANAGLSLSALDAIAFGRGPGSFTSLRIGIGVVQGLAWGAELPVVPVSSLASVAQQVFDVHSPDSGSTCVAMDARMREIYSCWYVRGSDGMAEAAGEETVGPPEIVPGPEMKSFVAAGNGFERFDSLAQTGRSAEKCFPEIWPRAGAVARLACHWMLSNEPLPPARAQPVYVRNEVAKKPRPV